MRPSRLLDACGWALGALLLWLLLRAFPLPPLARLIAAADKTALSIACVLALISVLAVGSERYRCILAGLGHRLTRGELLRLLQALLARESAHRREA